MFRNRLEEERRNMITPSPTETKLSLGVMNLISLPKKELISVRTLTEEEGGFYFLIKRINRHRIWLNLFLGIWMNHLTDRLLYSYLCIRCVVAYDYLGSLFDVYLYLFIFSYWLFVSFLLMSYLTITAQFESILEIYVNINDKLLLIMMLQYLILVCIFWKICHNGERRR